MESLPDPKMTVVPDLLNSTARETMRVSELRYRRLFETARDGIILLNADTAQIEDVNPFLIQLLGYSHTEFLGKKLWEVGAFADIALSKEMFVELQEKGYVRYEDLPLRRSDGKEIAVEFVSNSYDCDGVKVIQCNIRDISERKLAEQEQKATKERLSAIFDSSPDALLIVGPDGKIDMANRQAQTLLGYPVDELVGRPVDDFMPTRYRPGHPEQRAKFIETGVARLMGRARPIKALRKDGIECDVEVSLSRFQTDRGIFVASALRDISERIRASEEINKLAFFDHLTGLP